MLERLLRLAAIVCSLLVAIGWVWFAVDETKAASQQSADEVAGRQAARQPDPSPDQERAREKAHGPVQEAVDDANDVLLKPFAAVAESSTSKWMRRTIPAALALLVYGFGLGLLARYAAGRF